MFTWDGKKGTYCHSGGNVGAVVLEAENIEVAGVGFERWKLNMRGGLKGYQNRSPEHFFRYRDGQYEWVRGTDGLVLKIYTREQLESFKNHVLWNLGQLPSEHNFITMSEWIERVKLGAKGYQSGNANNHFTYRGGIFVWEGCTGERFLEEEFIEKFEVYNLWVEEAQNEVTIECDGKTMSEVYDDIKNLCGEIPMPKTKGQDMCETKVEVKIDGKVVAKTETKKAKKAKKVKYFGAWYDEDDVLEDTEYFHSKKEAKAKMQLAKNLGKTLELYRKNCILSTEIPVVEAKA